MTIDLDNRLTELFDDLAELVPIEASPVFGRSAPTRRDRPGRAPKHLLVAASVIAVVAAGTVAMMITVDRAAAPSSPRSTEAEDLAQTAPALFPEPAREIAWSVLTPDSTIAEAQISSIAAGPAGFVAVGLGFDSALSAGQGRVWFSADGAEWVEVDRDLFAPQGVYAVSATSTAYYLYAAPTPPTEGSPSGPPQLYRSANGVDWEPIGEPRVEAGQIVAVGDVLVRVAMSDGGMLFSTDGEQWVTAALDSLADSPAAVHYFDERILESDGTFYVRSWTADGTWEIWSSTDGQRWTQIATPRTPGRLTSTPDALLSVGNPGEGTCPAVDPTVDPEGALTAQWSCRLVPTIERLDRTTGEWTILASAPALASPTLPGVTALGNQLVAVVEGHDGAASVWLSSDGHSWTRGPVVPNELDTGAFGRGSPESYWVSGQNDTTIVIPISSHGVGDRGALVVGTIVDERS